MSKLLGSKLVSIIETVTQEDDGTIIHLYSLPDGTVLATAKEARSLPDKVPYISPSEEDKVTPR